MAAMADTEGGQRSGWRLAPWIGAAALLTVPALAMRFAPGAGVQWKALDFVVMGAMLAAACGAVELALRSLGATALAQVAAAAVALGGSPADAARPVEIAAVAGIFPALWLLSAWLFARAARA